VSSYSVAHEDFLNEVVEEHLEAGTMFGRIRFISGSWGSGKTHFLRLLREVAFEYRHLVATVELDRDEAPLNKFERVFYRITQSITSPEMYQDNDLDLADPLGEVLRRALFTTVGEDPGGESRISAGGLREAEESLFSALNLDVDFRRIVSGYWKTFLPDTGDSIALEERRALALSWFKGEGSLAPYRSAFGVQKMITRPNARAMLQSLAYLSRHLGYEGLVVLLDEGELSTSVLRRADVRAAHNNLRHLIDGIQDNNGLFAVYAATPDFFLNADYGVVTYGALAQRIGRPPDGEPAAYERVWNLDGIRPEPEHYQLAAERIRTIFLQAKPGTEDRVLSAVDLRARVRGMVELHPDRAQVSTWRIVSQGTVDTLNASLRGRLPESVKESYDSVRRRIETT
jgi:hypothetical protein